jgi:hypothetical protein
VSVAGAPAFRREARAERRIAGGAADGNPHLFDRCGSAPPTRPATNRSIPPPDELITPIARSFQLLGSFAQAAGG